MRILFLTYIFISTTVLWGQKGAKGAVFAGNSDKGVLVKWLSPELYNPQGFDVYRSNGNENWTKISAAPVMLNKNASDASYDTETKQLFKAIKDTPFDEFKSSLARAFVMIKAIYNNQFASDIGILYTDKSAEIGKSYKYKVTIANQSDPIGTSEVLNCGAFNPDFAPKDVIIDRKKKFISFSWKPDVYNYYGVEIYRKEVGAGDFINITKLGPIAIDITTQRKYKTTDVFFTDTAIDNTKGYIYKLVSTNYFGQKSAFTEDLSVPVKDFIPPATPYSFKVRPYSVDGYAKLTWEAKDEPDLNGFNVYSSQDPDGTFTKANAELLSKDSRTYDVLNLPVGDHYFVIAAVDLAGNTTTTGMMYGEMRDVIPPDAPTNLKCKTESGKITLTWSPNTEGDLKGYYVQKSLSDSNNLDNSYVLLNNELITATTYEIILPKNVKNEFVYRLVALDTLYNISKPSINSFAQMPDVIPPKTPVISNVSLGQDTGIIAVKWIANADTDIAGYKLLRRLNSDSSYSQINYSLIPKDVTEYKDRSVELGQQYAYVLQAVDNSGNESAMSNVFKFAMKKQATNATIIVTNSNYSARKKEISMQWKWQGDESLKGFVVYEMSDDGILKPFTGLSDNSELKVKQTLEGKRTYEIRGYTTNGEIIKSNLIVIDSNN